MTILTHVLGSDIPHHNQTVLQFFNDVLAQNSIHARKFMVVDKNNDKNTVYDRLSIDFWPDQATLAQAVIARARSNNRLHFFFHGQFNVWLWLALLNRSIKPSQFNWHIWGADFYEISHSWKFRLFYPFRRIAQGRVGCVFATRGDLFHFSQRYPNIRSELLYFPTRMSLTSMKAKDSELCTGKLSILVGNSGDQSNEHIIAFKSIYRQFGNTVNIIVPMGYPTHNRVYINKVYKSGCMFFGEENLKIISNKLEFNDYQSLIRKCDLGYFIFARQQGIGTLCLLIQAGVPCVISHKNPFWHDMVAQNIPVLFTTDVINELTVRKIQYQLAQTDKYKIDFFSPNYIAHWRNALRIAVESEI